MALRRLCNLLLYTTTPRKKTRRHGSTDLSTLLHHPQSNCLAARYNNLYTRVVYNIVVQHSHVRPVFLDNKCENERWVMIEISDRAFSRLLSTSCYYINCLDKQFYSYSTRPIQAKRWPYSPSAASSKRDFSRNLFRTSSSDTDCILTFSLGLSVPVFQLWDGSAI